MQGLIPKTVQLPIVCFVKLHKMYMQVFLGDGFKRVEKGGGIINRVQSFI